MFRDIPCNKDIYYANTLIKLNNFGYKESNILGAIILKWVRNNKIMFKNQTTGIFNKETSVIDLTLNPVFDNDLESKLFRMMYEASKDGMLEAKELGVDDKVCFMGFQSNPYKYLHNADCFVLSSEYEGLPNVMLEALYLGKPIVATESIPFVSKTLGDGKYGICVPVGDAHLFAQAMSKAVTIERYESHNVAADTFAGFMNVLNSEALR